MDQRHGLGSSAAAGTTDVVGGGSIGCELGQAFARLGSRVTLLEQADRLLPAEDPDASALVTQALLADGVDVRTGAGVDKVLGDGGDGTVRTTDGRTVGHDGLLVALGRQPRTRNIGLREAGVVVDAHGFVRVTGPCGPERAGLGRR